MDRGEEWTSAEAVRASTNKYKNNQVFGPMSSAHALLFSAFKVKKKRNFLNEIKSVSVNIQDHTFALSRF